MNLKPGTTKISFYTATTTDLMTIPGVLSVEVDVLQSTYCERYVTLTVDTLTFAITFNQLTRITNGNLAFHPIEADKKIAWTVEMACAYARTFHPLAVPALQYAFHSDLDGWLVRKVVFLGYFAPLNN